MNFTDAKRLPESTHVVVLDRFGESHSGYLVQQGERDDRLFVATSVETRHCIFGRDVCDVRATRGS